MHRWNVGNSVSINNKDSGGHNQSEWKHIQHIHYTREQFVINNKEISLPAHKTLSFIHSQRLGCHEIVRSLEAIHEHRFCMPPPGNVHTHTNRRYSWNNQETFRIKMPFRTLFQLSSSRSVHFLSGCSSFAAFRLCLTRARGSLFIIQYTIYTFIYACLLQSVIYTRICFYYLCVYVVQTQTFRFDARCVLYGLNVAAVAVPQLPVRGIGKSMHNTNISARPGAHDMMYIICVLYVYAGWCINN